MNLKEWQSHHGVSNASLAKKLGIDVSMLSHYHHGRRRPSPEVALKIEEVTGGEVTMKEAFFPALSEQGEQKAMSDP